VHSLRRVAIALSVVALIVAVASALISFRSWKASERSADAAVASDHRARTPQLVIELTRPAPFPEDAVIYRVRNDGNEDLDAVVIYRPEPPDRIIYPLAVTGTSWAHDIDVGPLQRAGERNVTFCCGPAEDLPEFRVRITCRAGTEEWPLTLLLADPRGRW
jgi:hypothetical protein